MPLIKSSSPAAAGATPFSVRDIEQQALLILARARKAAEREVAQARLDAEQIKADAKAAGLAEGKAAGHAEGLKQGKAAGQADALKQHSAQLTTLAKSLTTAVAEFDKERQAIASAASEEVVKLAVAIARRVCKTLGTKDGHVLSANAQEAVKLAVGKSDLRIAVNPAQRQALLSLLPQLKLQWPQIKHVELVDDPQLAAGGCRVHTAGGGQIDADLDHQVDRIAAELVS
jgi:flagellar assembly protein FliH